MPIVQASMAARESTGQRPQGVLNALTVDVEDYFQVSAFDAIIARSSWDSFESRIALGTAKILSALDAAGVRATFFVLGWVAERHPDLVRQIHAAGHEIGCHGYWHELVYQQTPETFRHDLRRARRAVEDAIGEQIAAYRAPSFSITRRSVWALDILIDEGFVIDSSIYPTVHDRYGLPGAPLGPHRIVRPHGSLWEFPLPVCRRFGLPLPVGGGGYFRLYPYGLTRAGLRALNYVGRPFATYIHPWELDPEQPRLTVGWLRAFRHYVNLHRTEERLKQLLADFRFGTLSDAFAGIHEHDELPSWEPIAA
jgi:polysaccharide deacetylase family protein (PEP-CTERM system associated)